MAETARFARSGEPRFRKNQAKKVPARKPTPVTISGQRNALIALPVRSKRCPMESLYISGAFFNRLPKSAFGGNGGEVATMVIQMTKAATPRTSIAREARNPLRRNGLPGAEFSSRFS